jgi:hypothetical protein
MLSAFYISAWIAGELSYPRLTHDAYGLISGRKNTFADPG